MRRQRTLLAIALLLFAIGSLAAVWLRWRAVLSPARPRQAANAAAAAGPGAGPPPAQPPPFVAFPDVLVRDPPLQLGIPAPLTGRPVRTGERLPRSPFLSWMRRERVVETGAESRVSLWFAGTTSPSAPTASGEVTLSLPHEVLYYNAPRTWLLAATAGERTSVLTLHRSPPLFERPDYDCTDTSNVSSIRTLGGSPTMLWLEVEERWSCRFNGASPSEDPSGRALPPDDGPHRMDRRLGLVVVAEDDATLRRLAAVVLREKGADGADSALEAVLTQERVLELRPATPAPSTEQTSWLGVHPLDPLLEQARAAPTWVDEPLPGGPVPATCAPSPGAPRLVVEADPPASAEPWRLNPEVTVLRVPYLTEQVRVRPFTVGAGGVRRDAAADPCLRVQLLGSGLRPTADPFLFEPLPRPLSVDTASLLALYRGQRVIVRFELAPPLGPPLPREAAALLAREAPGFQLPDRQRCPGWNFFADGPGLEIGDFDRDGRDDVAAVLIDDKRWRLVILSRTADGGYLLSFDHSTTWKKLRPGEPVEELRLEKTPDGDVQVRLWQQIPFSEGQAWRVRWIGARFQRETVPPRPASPAVFPKLKPIASQAELEDVFFRATSERELLEAVARVDLVARKRPPGGAALLTAAVPKLAAVLGTAGTVEPVRIHWPQAHEVMDVLARLGPLARQAVPAVEAVLRSPNCETRVLARRAMTSIRGGRYLPPDRDRDLQIECQGSLPPAPDPAAPPATRSSLRLPENTLVIRSVEEGGFEPPVALDWRELARGAVEGLDVDRNEGPAVEEARKRAQEGDYGLSSISFQRPLPPALQGGFYYAVTASGVVPFQPGRLLGDVGVSTGGVSGYHGAVQARDPGDGFVVISDAPLDVTNGEPGELARAWAIAFEKSPATASAEPRGLAFQLSRDGATERYLYAILPADDTCSDRRSLLRITGAVPEEVAGISAECDP